MNVAEDTTQVAANRLSAVLDLMTTLTDVVRCRVLLVLERHELTVSELCAVLQLPQSTVSRHLKVLADSSWVSSRRDGTSRFYTMSADNLDEGARRLWQIVREQVTSSSSAEQDERRVQRVLARRRSKSAQFFSTASGEWDRLRQSLFGDAFHLYAMLALLDSNATVGDLGCGTGQSSQLLAPFVGRVFAVDSSPEMLQTARERLVDHRNVTVRLGTLEALPLDDAQLDLAMMTLVLHHVPDPATALKECARVLRSGGRALVVDMLPHDRAEYQQQMGHVWLGFPDRQMRRMLTAAGFTHTRIFPLPASENAKGPALFAAVTTKQ